MSLFFHRKDVDKWENCPQNVDNSVDAGRKMSISPHYQQVIHRL